MTTQAPESTLATTTREALIACGVDERLLTGPREVYSPNTGEHLINIKNDNQDAVVQAIDEAYEAFKTWRETPAPVRGQVVKRWAELLTEHKQDLAALVTAEVGKIPSEAEGEVQEMIDICDFAVGQSRMLYGQTMPSERPGHRLMETWHPLGVVGVITAFNFPVAPYAWNTALALVAGDSIVWKPSAIGSLCALATDALLARAVADSGAPAGIH
ncbi:MAG: aldehyde dehydrogenase family protein, partial [Yaniella sp.]|nr:aldehyde dehydrogenase family protein [Yaniella sp.]